MSKSHTLLFTLCVLTSSHALNCMHKITITNHGPLLTEQEKDQLRSDIKTRMVNGRNGMIATEILRNQLVKKFLLTLDPKQQKEEAVKKIKEHINKKYIDPLTQPEIKAITLVTMLHQVPAIAKLIQKGLNPIDHRNGLQVGSSLLFPRQ